MQVEVGVPGTGQRGQRQCLEATSPGQPSRSGARDGGEVPGLRQDVVRRAVVPEEAGSHPPTSEA